MYTIIYLQDHFSLVSCLLLWKYCCVCLSYSFCKRHKHVSFNLCRHASDNYLYLYRALVLVGLIVIAVGTGGIKPCVAAFGGDQFQETEVMN